MKNLLFLQIENSFKGFDYDAAKQMLITTNYDLQQAVNLHFERVRGLSGSNDVSPEDEVAGKLLHNINSIES